VRLGLTQVTSIDETVATRIVAARDAGGPFSDLADLVRRTSLTTAQVEALATAGAFEPFGLTVRQALWQAGQAAQVRSGHLAGIHSVGPPPHLPGMSNMERTVADIWATKISPEDHPIRHLRSDLDARDVIPTAKLSTVEPGSRVRVGGVVTHRQRPSTAGGVTFLNIEDETGMINVVCSPGLWTRYRRIAGGSAALIVRGRVEHADGVTNLVADGMQRLPLAARTTSRNFR
jgi:error-prone DNA polymerase